jgi:hypothetical protein
MPAGPTAAADAGPLAVPATSKPTAKKTNARKHRTTFTPNEAGTQMPLLANRSCKWHGEKPDGGKIATRMYGIARMDFKRDSRSASCARRSPALRA